MDTNSDRPRKNASLVRQTIAVFIEILLHPKRGFEHLRTHPNRVHIALMMMVIVTVPYYIAYLPGYFFVEASGVAVGWVTIWQRVVPFHSIYGFFCITFPWHYIITLALVGLFVLFGLFAARGDTTTVDAGTVFPVVVFATQVPTMLDGLLYEQFFVYYQLITGATETPGWYYYLLFSMMLIMLIWMPSLYYLGFRSLFKSASRRYAALVAGTAFLLNLVMNWLWWGKIPLSFYQ